MLILEENLEAFASELHTCILLQNVYKFEDARLKISLGSDMLSNSRTHGMPVEQGSSGSPSEVSAERYYQENRLIEVLHVS